MIDHTPDTNERISNDECPTYWNSHSCDLPSGHVEPHTCTPSFLCGDGPLFEKIPGTEDYCAIRWGCEDDVVHVDPTDSCGNRECTVCFDREPDHTYPGGLRPVGRSRPREAHDVSSCRWCSSIVRNSTGEGAGSE